MDKKILITGTGRAGTSFLIKLLTACGADTGFQNNDFRKFPQKCGWVEKTRSGYEMIIPANWKKSNVILPRVIKDPKLCSRIGNLYKQGFPIERVIVPVRDLFEAAESRRKFPHDLAFGLNEKDFPSLETFLASVFGALITDLLKYEIPYTLLFYPKFATDKEYLWNKICKIFPEITKEKFMKKFAETVDLRSSL